MRPAVAVLVVAGLLGLSAGFNGCDETRSDEGGAGTGNAKSAEKSQEATGDRRVPEEGPGPVQPGKMEVTLYFSDENAEKLVAERRTIPKTPAVAAAVVRELIKGPEKIGSFPTLPKSMKLLGVKTKGGTAVVNLSNVRKSGIGGSAAEMMIVFSIVNSLTEIPTIKDVQFLVDGKRREVLLDAFDITRPVERDESLIAR